MSMTQHEALAMTEHELRTMVEQGMAVNLVGAACLTALLYDHLLTLDQEIMTIWPARLSIAKVLFLLNRYPVAAMLLFNCISASRTYLPDAFCYFFMRWHSVVSITSTIIVQGILMLRVWALHRINKWALYTGFFFYFGGSLALISLLVENYVGEEVILNKALDSLPGCYAMSVPKMIAGQWITPLIVESVLFLLVVSRAYYWWKDGIAAPRIFSLLARDSAMYFMVVFVLLLSNYLLFEFGPAFLSSLLVTPLTTAGCILGSHMILHLREMISSPTEEDYDNGKPHVLPLRRAVLISVTKTQDRDDTESSSGTTHLHPRPPPKTFGISHAHRKPESFNKVLFEKHLNEPSRSS